MSLSLRDVPADEHVHGRIERAEVIGFSELKDADKFMLDAMQTFHGAKPHNVFMCAAGLYFVILTQGELVGDTDVTQHNS